MLIVIFITLLSATENQLARWKVSLPLSCQVMNMLNLIQFCVHTDKQQLLSTLTRKLQTSADDRLMLYELSKTIASGNEMLKFSLPFIFLHSSLHHLPSSLPPPSLLSSFPPSLLPPPPSFLSKSCASG